MVAAILHKPLEVLFSIRIVGIYAIGVRLIVNPGKPLPGLFHDLLHMLRIGTEHDHLCVFPWHMFLEHTPQPACLLQPPAKLIDQLFCL